VITNDKTWNLISMVFQDIQSSKKITKNVMSKIKELESKNDKDSNK
jgi:hypothetical protein